MKRSLPSLVASLAVASMALGCSFSYSSESISKIISSPFESSSKSSSPDDSASTAYLRDVEALSQAFGDPAATPESFLRELGRVAMQHGIDDWESHPETYRAIGVGLRRSGVDEERARLVASELFGPGTPAAQAVLRSYQT